MKLPKRTYLRPSRKQPVARGSYLLARSPGLQEDDHAVLTSIMESENRIVATLQENDIAAFGRLLSDDLIDVEDDGIHGKAEWLTGFQK
jgi:hypothetical protein